MRVDASQDDGCEAGRAGGRWYAFEERLDAFIWGFDVESRESQEGTARINEARDEPKDTGFVECKAVDQERGGDPETDAVGEAVELHAKFRRRLCPASDFAVESVEDDAADNRDCRVLEQQ